MTDDEQPGDTPEPHAAREPWPAFDDRPRCVNHQQPEPCGICQSYIAAGL